MALLFVSVTAGAVLSICAALVTQASTAADNVSERDQRVVDGGGQVVYSSTAQGPLTVILVPADRNDSSPATVPVERELWGLVGSQTGSQAEADQWKANANERILVVDVPTDGLAVPEFNSDISSSLSDLRTTFVLGAILISIPLLGLVLGGARLVAARLKAREHVLDVLGVADNKRRRWRWSRVLIVCGTGYLVAALAVAATVELATPSLRLGVLSLGTMVTAPWWIVAAGVVVVSAVAGISLQQAVRSGRAEQAKLGRLGAATFAAVPLVAGCLWWLRELGQPEVDRSGNWAMQVGISIGVITLVSPALVSTVVRLASLVLVRVPSCEIAGAWLERRARLSAPVVAAVSVVTVLTFLATGGFDGAPRRQFDADADRTIVSLYESDPPDSAPFDRLVDGFQSGGWQTASIAVNYVAANGSDGMFIGSGTCDDLARLMNRTIQRCEPNTMFALGSDVGVVGDEVSVVDLATGGGGAHISGDFMVADVLDQPGLADTQLDAFVVGEHTGIRQVLLADVPSDAAAVTTSLVELLPLGGAASAQLGYTSAGNQLRVIEGELDPSRAFLSVLSRVVGVALAAAALAVGFAALAGLQPETTKLWASGRRQRKTIFDAAAFTSIPALVASICAASLGIASGVLFANSTRFVSVQAWTVPAALLVLTVLVAALFGGWRLVAQSSDATQLRSE